MTTNKLSEMKTRSLQENSSTLFLPKQDEHFIQISPTMTELYDKVKQIAKVNAPVLIKGEIDGR